MRYKIEINLLALEEMGSKINLEEAVLLDYLYWLCTSPSEEVEKMRIEKDGEKYTWFDYGFYLKETPILRGKTKASITPKIKKLEEEGFIKTINYAEKGKDKFSKKYIKLLPKVDGLFRKVNEVVKKTKQGSFRKVNIDNNTTIDNKTTDNTLSKDKEIDINHFIDKFKLVNPSYEKLFGNKTQRKSIENLLDKLGPEKLEKLIDFLPAIFGKPYAPRITTPYQLEEKLGDLIAYIKAERSKKPKIGIVR